MIRRFARTAVGALCLAALIGASGCGARVGGWAGPSEVDVRTLDVGNYEVRPLDVHVDYRPGFVGAPSAAGMRLAEYVVTADQVDPALTEHGRSHSFSDGVLPGAVGDTDEMADTAERDHMVYGFTTTGGDKNADRSFHDWPEPKTPNATVLSMSVMGFNDSAAATRAAEDLYNTDFATYKDQNKPVELAKYPQAHAHWRPGTASIRSFLAHGPYVVSVLALTPSPALSALTELTEKAYATEFPVLDRLEPITDEETVQLPWDPNYLLSRALNTGQSGRPQYGDDNGVFGPHAILHYLPDRKIAAQRVAALKAEEFAKTSDALVVRTADAASAHKAVTDRIFFEGGGPPIDPVPAIADSACIENGRKNTSFGGPKRYICVVAYRNYIGYVTSNQLVDVHQRAAAQYALFANSQWQP